MIKASEEWFADHSYWEENRSFIWTDRRISNSGIGAESAMKLLAACKGESILDLACGFGRHSIEFSRLGLSVTGVDLNSKFIDEAISKAVAANSSIRFIRADMRDFIERESFNNIVIAYNSFGYFENPEDDRRVISNCFESLLPGGKLLISIMGKEVNHRNMPSGISRYWMEEDGSFRLLESLFNKESSRLTMRWILLHGNEQKEFIYSVRLYSKQEISELLSDSGFEKIQCYGGMRGIPYDENAHSLVVTAQKPR